MRQFVRNARNANPNLQFALANIPQRSFIGGRQDLVDKTTRYNTLFPAAVQDLNTDASPVKLVDFAGAYNCQPSGCPSGYDGEHLHPAIDDMLVRRSCANSTAHQVCILMLLESIRSLGRFL